MSRATIVRNPLHPMLNDVPSAMTPASFAFDLAGTLTGNERLHDAARYALVGALIGSVPAALAGLADYTDLPDPSRTRRTATIHGALNAGLMGLTALNLWLHRDGRSGTAPLVLGAVVNVGMLASGWLGTSMVYEDGVGVAGTDHDYSNPAAAI